MNQPFLKWDRNWEIGAMLYLSFPAFIFFLGWLALPWAFLSALLLLIGLGAYFYSLGPGQGGTPFSGNQVMGIIGIGLGIAFFSGISGHLPQSFDYIKHHEVWQDLSEKEWPVSYQNRGKSYFLDYYLAYYLPGALVAKTFAVDYTLPSALWGTLGVLLLAFGLCRKFGKYPLVSLVIFFLIGGQDLVMVNFWGMLDWIREGHFVVYQWREWRVDDPQLLSFIYKGPFNQLIWAPQHGIGAWLATLLVWNRISERAGGWSSLLPWTLTLFWSPFVSLGLLPFLALDGRRGLKASLMKILHLLPSFFIGLLFFFYYQAHGPLIYNGFIWNITTRENWLLFYFLFTLSELGAFALLVFWVWKKEKPEPLLKTFFLISLVLLILLPFYHMGRMNDFIMRASIPALLFFYLTTIRSFWISWKLKKIRWIFAFILLISCIHNPSEAWIIYHDIEPSIQERYPMDDIDLVQLEEAYIRAGLPPDFDLSGQYLGEDSSFFYRVFLKSKSNHE